LRASQPAPLELRPLPQFATATASGEIKNASTEFKHGSRTMLRRRSSRDFFRCKFR